MSEYQDKIVDRRKRFAERSRQRHHRSRGDLLRSRTLCIFCGSYFFAALGVCDCPGSRRARAKGDTAA